MIGIEIILLEIVQRLQSGKDNLNSLHEIQDIGNLLLVGKDCLIRRLTERMKEIIFDRTMPQ